MLMKYCFQIRRIYCLVGSRLGNHWECSMPVSPIKLSRVAFILDCIRTQKMFSKHQVLLWFYVLKLISLDKFSSTNIYFFLKQDLCSWSLIILVKWYVEGYWTETRSLLTIWSLACDCTTDHFSEKGRFLCHLQLQMTSFVCNSFIEMSNPRANYLFKLLRGFK